MVSFTRPSGEERLPSAGELARFLELPEEDVLRLLNEGRLGGTILHTLRLRGVAITPAVKDSAQTLVRAMEPDRPDTAATPAEQPGHGTTTATIMFTDIVGSTALLERLGDREGRRALTRHDEIIRRETAAHDGAEVKSLGDGFMLTFGSARRGVACACAVQRAMVEHYSRRPGSPIPVRIGISVGEPVHDRNDLFGTSVVMAARIMAKANGGQVLVSEIVYALASSSGDFHFRPAGQMELKGLAGTHQVYEVIWEDLQPNGG